MARKSTKLQRYQFALTLFADMFKTGNKIAVAVKEGWPKDAVVVGLHPDEKTYSFTVIVHSKKFKSVKSGEEIPYGRIIFESLV